MTVIRTALLALLAATSLSAATIDVSPSQGPVVGGNLVIISGQLNNGCRNLCGNPAVLFDGVIAETVRINGDVSIEVIAPPHAVGPVEVVYRDTIGATITADEPYIYEASEITRFERVLLPVVVDASAPLNGAYGSRWITETYGVTSQALRVTRDPVDCTTCPDTVAPGITFTPALSTSLSGVILHVEVPDDTQEASPVVLHHRVRDLSRQSLSWGTELPVVRESAVRQGKHVELLNVPLDARFRQTLRVYDIGGRQYEVLIRFFEANGNEILTNLPSLPLTPGRYSPSGHLIAPSYLELSSFVDALPQLRGHERVRVQILPTSRTARMYAFISITNNATQHVTTITE